MSQQYNRKDALYKQAKEDGYRSRAAYKLIELNQKLKIFKGGDKVLDLGCYPGGWMQVASKLVGPKGLVIGIDRVEVERLPQENIQIIHGDILESDQVELLTKHMPFDVIMSDMSPSLSGIKDKDDAGMAELLKMALDFAKNNLSKSGWFLAKTFPGKDCDELLRVEKPNWQKFQFTNLKSTRGSSIEKYIYAKGLK
jgi:23S rRNA (uridine2552-2'-O)-methyltransferase